ncbi:MAG: Carboxypeptidase regulatory-like domain [Pseudomonadota bacterium]|jgi:hypothetical protein
MRNTGTLRGLTVAFALAGTAAPALANGGDFFAEFAAQLAAENGVGPAYFGFVRDEQGRTVQGAAVTATIMPNGSAITVRTDVLGHYKVSGFVAEIDPASVEISCSKPGYAQVSAARRHTRNPDAPVETDCLLAPVTAEAS